MALVAIIKRVARPRKRSCLSPRTVAPKESVPHCTVMATVVLWLNVPDVAVTVTL